LALQTENLTDSDQDALQRHSHKHTIKKQIVVQTDVDPGSSTCYCRLRMHSQKHAVYASVAEQQASPMGWPVLVVQ